MCPSSRTSRSSRPPSAAASRRSRYKAILPPPAFVVSGVGADFPAAPVGYKLATIADVQSAAFVTLYNSNSLAWVGTASMSGCCVFAVKDAAGNAAYLTQSGGMWWSMFTAGAFMCSSTPASPVGLGFAPGFGPEAGQYVPTLDASYTSAMTTTPALDPALGCGTPADTFAIYKAI